MDSCRRELVALDSTGNFFAEDILTGAVIGAAGGAVVGGVVGRGIVGVLGGAALGSTAGAAVGYWNALQRQGRDQAQIAKRVYGDLVRENTEIDRTQAAFDVLADCRFRQARVIRTAYATGRMPKVAVVTEMERLRARSRRDIQLALMINDNIAGRGAEFETAADNLSPGTRYAIRAARTIPPREAIVVNATAVKLRPNAASLDLGNLRTRERVWVTAPRDGYVIVETSRGERGYAPLSALGDTGTSRREVRVAGDPVRTLASSNAARRDDFAASVAVIEQASVQEFEPGK